MRNKTVVKKSEIACWFDDPREVSEALRNADVKYACYETGRYEGEWLVVFTRGRKWFSATGSHCSCNGPYWNETEMTKDEVKEFKKDRKDKG